MIEVLLTLLLSKLTESNQFFININLQFMTFNCLFKVKNNKKTFHFKNRNKSLYDIYFVLFIHGEGRELYYTDQFETTFI